jgi:DNA polymerase III epsilon subunit-like protein
VRLPSAADTEVLGRLWLQHAGEAAPARLSLGRLARVLGQQPESEHHALADALATAQAFIALAGHLDALEPQSVGTLISASQRLRGSGRFGPS